MQGLVWKRRLARLSSALALWKEQHEGPPAGLRWLGSLQVSIMVMRDTSIAREVVGMRPSRKRSSVRLRWLRSERTLSSELTYIRVSIL